MSTIQKTLYFDTNLSRPKISTMDHDQKAIWEQYVRKKTVNIKTIIIGFKRRKFQYNVTNRLQVLILKSHEVKL